MLLPRPVMAAMLLQAMLLLMMMPLLQALAMLLPRLAMTAMLLLVSCADRRQMRPSPTHCCMHSSCLQAVGKLSLLIAAHSIGANIAVSGKC
mmetsp:Transcript_35062/g.89702  ORF Transcript_35062/g.89702 Transcript_35062/m.89702 type:complete len:92 (-) Transcript_35062:1722-1997(-)